MKISTNNAIRLINVFESAVRVHEMKGARHPDDWEKIEKKYQLAKKKLREFCFDAIIL